MRRLVAPLALGLVASGLAALTTVGSAGSAAAAVPRLQVTRLAGGLDHPWDVKPVGGGRYLVTERDRARLTLVLANGSTRDVAFPSRRVWVSGETGLMGLEVDPGFAGNRRIYTCQGATTPGGGHDVRVVSWTLDKRLTRARKPTVLVSGFPTSTGRHGGCRLLVASDGSLYVGTGDAAQGSNPEDLTSLGGKVLRLDRRTGEPWTSNLFIDAADIDQRYVQSYGHRNVQGLAERSDGSVWAVEHGTYRDDEVNRLVSGGDYGYDPVPPGGGAGYDESVPMTDQDLPGTQVEAAWRSGDPTIAPGGADFVRGKRWGSLRGSLAMAVLKDERVLFLSFDSAGVLRKTRAPRALRALGRVRTVVSDTDGSLLVTTDNGDGRDGLFRVRPR
jgi:glucose/arabinose dehydrogenase